MSNMSYCRFENTNRDLVDCQQALEELANGDGRRLSDRELRSAKLLVTHCFDIVQLVADWLNVDLDDEDAFNTAYDGLQSAVDFANSCSKEEE